MPIKLEPALMVREPLAAIHKLLSFTSQQEKCV